MKIVVARRKASGKFRARCRCDSGSFIDMDKNNKFIGPGATGSKDRIAALLFISTPRSNSFATVGGTRHCGLGLLAHIELSTVAFQYPSLERRNYPELSCIGGLHLAGIPKCMPFSLLSDKSRHSGTPERSKADSVQWLYSIANHSSQARNQSRNT